MTGLPQGKMDMSKEWESHYGKLFTDKAKCDLLLMLKERRDRYGDASAGKVFALLNARWVAENFKA